MTKEELKALQEAPASLNFYTVSRKGYNIQWTLRDVDEFALLERFGKFVVKLEECHIQPKGNGASTTAKAAPTFPNIEYPNESIPAPEETITPEDWCPIHGLKMGKWEKEGRSWYSHKTDDGSWCKGK